MLHGPYVDAVLAQLTELDRLVALSGELGEMPAGAIELLRTTSLMDALKPREYSGDAAHPVDFYAGVVSLSAAYPALGWIAGVLGVHAFEIALTSPQACADVWADSTRDNWIASPFTQSGTAVEVPDGYLLSGRWDFSSGFRLADWLCIGGKIAASDGSRLGRNFCLPRNLAQEIPGTWDVIGLQDTASVSFSIDNQFVPSYCVYDPKSAIEGVSWQHFDYKEALYRMPRQTMLSSAVSAATLGAGLGVVQAVIAFTQNRLKGSSKRQAVRDPYILRSIAEAESDVEAGITTMLTDLEEIHDSVSNGHAVTRDRRMRYKRNLVRSVHRSGESLNELFTQCGGGAIRADSRVQMFWRDFQAGRNHNSHIFDWYNRYGHELFGLEALGGVV